MEVEATQGKVKLFKMYTLTAREAHALARDLQTAAYMAERQDALMRRLYVAQRNGSTHKEK